MKANVLWFNPSDQMDEWSILCPFVDKPIPTVQFPHVNSGFDRIKEISNEMQANAAIPHLVSYEDRPFGLLSKDDREAINYLGSMKEGKTIVELGSYLGGSAFEFWKYSHDLWCVDHWKSAPHTSMLNWHGVDVYPLWRKNCERFGIYPHEMRMDTSEAARVFADQSVDLLFIDSWHRYDMIDREWKAWMPKMKAGSILSGHDFDIPDISRWVNQHFSDVRTKGKVWWVQL